MSLRYVIAAMTSVSVLAASVLTADAVPPFEYKADRPGVTTFSEFHQIHKSIFEKYPRRNTAYDIAHNIYESHYEISCDRPAKGGAYITELAFCDTFEESDTGVLIGWDFVGGVMAYVNVYFPKDDYDQTLSLLEAKYGKAAAISRGVVHIEGGPALPYVQESWKSSTHTMVLRSLSENNVDHGSLQISDDPLHHRYLNLTSNAQI